MHRLHNTVYARLDSIKASEAITRVELAELSREALIYVVDTADIDLVNRLLGVLTPVNKLAALAFFREFIPHVEEKNGEEFSRFGGQMKARAFKRKVAAIGDFLANEENNIWTWCAINVVVEQKPKDTGKGLAKALKQALEGVDTDRSIAPPMPPADVMKVIMEQIDPDTMLSLIMEINPDTGHPKMIEGSVTEVEDAEVVTE